MGDLGQPMENKACSGKATEPEYRLSKISQRNGFTIRVFRPILSEEEADFVAHKIVNDFVRAMTE